MHDEAQENVTKRKNVKKHKNMKKHENVQYGPIPMLLHRWQMWHLTAPLHNIHVKTTSQSLLPMNAWSSITIRS